MTANYQLFAWLIATAVITAPAMIYASQVTHTVLATFAAWMFAVIAMGISATLNARSAHSKSAYGSAAGRARLNAALLAIIFAWGGLVILGAYYLTDLFWHHAWQYGLGMCLIAGLLFAYRQRLLEAGGRFSSPGWLTCSARLALLQAVVAGVGLAFLVASGKLARHNPDWIANHVFMAGGMAVVAVSIMAYRAQSSGDDRT